MTNAGGFGFWAGAGVTGWVAGLLWLRRPTSPGWRGRRWRADGPSPEGGVRGQLEIRAGLESASGALDR
jgi:hypothetical protein